MKSKSKNMKINKKFLQLLATVWILVFHLWILLSQSTAEQFVVKTGYVGVDIFFFLSAYSMSKRELEYSKFLKNRFTTIYLRFVFFVLTAAVYFRWGWIRIVKNLMFLELFERGGGAFLWYVPAAMILYILFPWFVKWKAKGKGIYVLVGWFLFSLVLDHLVGYHKIFIFTSRIPVILCGYYAATLEKEKKQKNGRECCLAGGLIIFGEIALFLGGFRLKLNIPFKDAFYLLAIPLTLGAAFISSYIPENRVISRLADASLEVYALQMIFGTGLVTWIYRLTGNKGITNILMIVGIFLASVILETGWSWMVKGRKKVLQRQEDRQR